MKLATLLAGVAAATLVAAPAMAGDPIYQGSYTPNLLGGTSAGNINGSGVANGLAVAGLIVRDALNVENNVNQNTSMILITGGAQNNNGQESDEDGATFTLTGNVTPDCAYYSGNVDTDIDFGEIGIYASDNTGPANAFDMVAPASVTIETNLAGCNTNNTVTISKDSVNGLVNAAPGGYDSNVFQANLPYTAVATYTAGSTGSQGAASSGSWVNVGLNNLADSETHGAWKSAMDVVVNIPVPSKSLVAGDYEGELTVTIEVL